MKYENIYGDIPKTIAKEVEEVAVARARYKVQEDFNRELIKKIAKLTGHENLAATCFVEVDLDGEGGLNTSTFTDDDLIMGLYSSNSSFHKSGDGWESITDHYSMHREEFWEKKADGYGDESHGIVNTEWLVDNFYFGRYYITNGWPRGTADFLRVYRVQGVPVEPIIDAYHKKYAASGRLNKYIQQEINAML